MVKPLTEEQKTGYAALRAARAAKEQAKEVKTKEKEEGKGQQKRKAEDEQAAGPSPRVTKKVKVHYKCLGHCCELMLMVSTD